MMTGVDETTEERTSPRTVTSRRRIRYRRSEWKVREFEVWSGGAVCRATLVQARGSLLLWAGAPGAAARLGDLALASPAPPGLALATPLLGRAEGAVPLARRLAAALSCPVYVCCGDSFDRFTLPLVERALLLQIKEPDRV